MTPPDPNSIDFTQIAAWSAGITVVAGSIVGAVIQAVRIASRIARNTPSPPPAMHKTDVYTTDSIALERLEQAVRESNILWADALIVMREGNALRAEATRERRSLKEALDINTAATERSVQVNSALQLETRDLIKEVTKLSDRVHDWRRQG